VRLAAGAASGDDGAAVGEAGRNWRRPEPAPLDPATQPLS